MCVLRRPRTGLFFMELPLRTRGMLPHPAWRAEGTIPREEPCTSLSLREPWAAVLSSLWAPQSQNHLNFHLGLQTSKIREVEWGRELHEAAIETRPFGTCTRIKNPKELWGKLIGSIMDHPSWKRRPFFGSLRNINSVPCATLGKTGAVF